MKKTNIITLFALFGLISEGQVQGIKLRSFSAVQSRNQNLIDSLLASEDDNLASVEIDAGDGQGEKSISS